MVMFYANKKYAAKKRISHFQCYFCFRTLEYRVQFPVKSMAEHGGPKRITILQLQVPNCKMGVIVTVLQKVSEDCNTEGI